MKKLLILSMLLGIGNQVSAYSHWIYNNTDNKIRVTAYGIGHIGTLGFDEIVIAPNSRGDLETGAYCTKSLIVEGLSGNVQGLLINADQPFPNKCVGLRIHINPEQTETPTAF